MPKLFPRKISKLLQRQAGERHSLAPAIPAEFLEHAFSTATDLHERQVPIIDGRPYCTLVLGSTEFSVPEVVVPAVLGAGSHTSVFVAEPTGHVAAQTAAHRSQFSPVVRINLGRYGPDDGETCWTPLADVSSDTGRVGWHHNLKLARTLLNWSSGESAAGDYAEFASLLGCRWVLYVASTFGLSFSSLQR